MILLAKMHVSERLHVQHSRPRLSKYNQVYSYKCFLHFATHMHCQTPQYKPKIFNSLVNAVASLLIHRSTDPFFGRSIFVWSACCSVYYCLKLNKQRKEKWALTVLSWLMGKYWTKTSSMYAIECVAYAANSLYRLRFGISYRLFRVTLRQRYFQITFYTQRCGLNCC